MKKFLKMFAVVFGLAFASIGLAACSCKKDDGVVELNAENLVGEWEVAKIVYTPGEDSTLSGGMAEAATLTRAEWNAIVAKQTAGEALTQEDYDNIDRFEDTFYTYRIKNDHKMYHVTVDADDKEQETEAASWAINHGKIVYTAKTNTYKADSVEWDNGKIVITALINADTPQYAFTYVMTLEKVK